MFITTGDFDGDGNTDLVTANNGTNDISVLLNQSTTILLGDVNRDGVVTLLDVDPFVDLVVNEGFQAEADINQDGVVDLLDVQPFVEILIGG